MWHVVEQEELHFFDTQLSVVSQQQHIFSVVQQVSQVVYLI